MKNAWVIQKIYDAVSPDPYYDGRKMIQMKLRGQWHDLISSHDGQLVLKLGQLDERCYRFDLDRMTGAGVLAHHVPWTSMGFIGALSGGSGYAVVPRFGPTRMRTELMS